MNSDIMSEKLIIFDLDGTLYKTEEVSIPALKEAFSKFGIELTEEKILEQFGEPTDQIIDNLVHGSNKIEKEKIEKTIVEKEREAIPERAVLYEGVKELLKTLSDDGHILAICSNGRYDYIEDVLKNTSIREYFSSIKGYSEETNKSDRIKDIMEEFSVEEAVMVGDRYHDIEAAKEAGIVSIGALYGYGDQEAKKADHKAEKPIDILSILMD